MTAQKHPLAHTIPYWNQLAVGRVTGPLRTMSMEHGYDGGGGTSEGFLGVFIEADNQPSWARKIARYDRDQFRRETPHKLKRFGDVDSSLEDSGKGECHINSSDAARLWTEDQKQDEDAPFRRSQSFGSCVDASLAEGISGMLGWRAARPEFKEQWSSPAGWYEGANRGYTADGQSLYQAARISSQVGYCLMREYRSGGDFADLNGDDENEALVWRSWTKSGGIPDWLQAITAEKHRFFDGAITEFEGHLDELRKLLAAGGFLHTGGTYTSGGPGDPISPVGTVGAHAQTCFGYDDSEQFRKWYKDRGGRLIAGNFPIVMHQTWGDQWSGWCPPAAWPEWWGIRPSGAWCWWATDLLKYLGDGSFAYLPLLQGVPAEIPVPPPVPSPVPPIPNPPGPDLPALTGSLTLTVGSRTYDYVVMPAEEAVDVVMSHIGGKKKHVVRVRLRE